MDLRFTNNTRPTINLEEDYYVEGWKLINDEVTRLHDKAWTFQLKGRDVLANQYTKGANYHIYLFYYALFLRRHLDVQGTAYNNCDSSELNDTFKIECVEKNLPCLSSKYDTDYLTTWNALLSEFGISRQTEGCDDGCCLGIGEMIIEDPSDCISNIIGDCDENIIDNGDTYGEFSPCEFVVDEFTEGIGDDIYNDCDFT
jgi:hypothetical protein